MLQFIQEKILLSIYPWCSIEEAKKKESKIPWCKVIIKPHHYEVEVIGFDRDTLEYIDDERDRFKEHHIIEILGLPPTLSRVLYCFGIEFYFWNGIRHAEKISNNYENRTYICDRKLLNSEWTDATLFDQSEETQKVIALLLGWNDVTSKNN